MVPSTSGSGTILGRHRRRRPPATAGSSSTGTKTEIDRLVDLILDRLQGHDAGLTDRRPNVTGHAQAAVAMQRDVEDCLEAREVAQPRKLGDGGANRFIGHQIDLTSGFGYVADSERHAPGKF